MRITSVSFNLGPRSPSSALTIREHSFGHVIKAPEWQAGKEPKPVAYAGGALGNEVLVQVTVEGGLPDTELELVGHSLTNRVDNVLGTPKSGLELLDQDGSGAIDCVLSNHQLDKAPVGKFEAAWAWKARSGTGWVDIGSTKNDVYLILDSPGPPWGPPGSGDDLQLPWVNALEVATAWGRGARTLDEAAQAITRAVNAVPSQTYNSAPTFGGGSTYFLSQYLERAYYAPQRSRGFETFFSVNCTDCADAVTTLGNLLGCRLFEGRIIIKGDEDNTHPIVTTGWSPLSDAAWKRYAFGYHETAWTEPFSPQGSVYDACLHVDHNLGKGPRCPELPTGMSYEAYNPLLIATDATLDHPKRHRSVQ